MHIRSWCRYVDRISSNFHNRTGDLEGQRGTSLVEQGAEGEKKRHVLCNRDRAKPLVVRWNLATDRGHRRGRRCHGLGASYWPHALFRLLHGRIRDSQQPPAWLSTSGSVPLLSSIFNQSVNWLFRSSPAYDKSTLWRLFCLSNMSCIYVFLPGNPPNSDDMVHVVVFLPP